MRCNKLASCMLAKNQDAGDAGAHTGYQNGGYLRVKEAENQDSKMAVIATWPRQPEPSRTPPLGSREITTQVTAEHPPMDEWKIITPKKHRDTPPS